MSELCQRFALAECGRQIQGVLKFDVVGDSCFYECLNTLKARTLSHFLLLNLCGTEVSVSESVSNSASQRRISN